MDSSRLLVLCSSQPGFLRSLAGHLAGRYRLLECYSPNEAAQMVHLHHPDVALLDLRKATSQQLSRAWAMSDNSGRTSMVVVTEPGELQKSPIPSDIAHRIVNVETAACESDYAAVIDAVEHLAWSAGQPVVRNVHANSSGASAAAKDAERIPRMLPSGCFDGCHRINESDFADGDGCERPSIVTRFRTRTPALRKMLERLEVAAKHDVAILLIGETGSGKTHLARLIHESSERHSEPLLTVACGALPKDLIESELFGHVKGSFTSAYADKQGKFVAAGRGTILLDEIDSLSPEQQVKLLRVIEKGLFEPVGSNETMQVEARIIAASNLELEPLVEQGRFRADLYYRLNTLTFSIPPLRHRLPDVEPLVRYFVHLHGFRHQIDVVNITDEFIERLVTYPWPGNVREMENAIRSAVIYSQGGRLTVDTLPPNIIAGAAGPGNDPSVAAMPGSRRGNSLGNRIELTEKDIIEQALLSNGFSRTRTAKQLGISRVTLYNKMKKYDMMPNKAMALNPESS